MSDGRDTGSDRRRPRSSEKDTFDLVVVGTGPAGSSIARRLAEKGRRVAVVEAREPGGTCALRGCNPKKVLVNAAELLQRARDGEGTLVRFSEARIDWSALIEFKDRFVDPVTPSTVEGLQEAGIELLRGRASFEGRGSLRVGERTVDAGTVVLATGARPAELAFEGAEHVTTSDEFLELEALPERLLFVGGGYVSMELAHVAVRAGARVTVADRGARPLRGFDEDLVARLVERTRELGVDLRTGAEVERIRREGDTLRVELSGDETVECEAVVHGAGRVPDLGGLALERADVAFEDDGVTVDPYMRSTTNPRVIAVGDCAASGAPKLTPVANAHAHAVVQNLASGQARVRPDTLGVASVVFTVPCLARAGLGLDEAREQGLDFDLLEGDMSSWGSVRKVGGRVAAYRILVAKDSRRILGAHLFGPGCEETIQLFTLALRAGMKQEDLKSAPFAFPTFGHDVRSML